MLYYLYYFPSFILVRKEQQECLYNCIKNNIVNTNKDRSAYKNKDSKDVFDLNKLLPHFVFIQALCLSHKYVDLQNKLLIKRIMSIIYSNSFIRCIGFSKRSVSGLFTYDNTKMYRVFTTIETTLPQKILKKMNILVKIGQMNCLVLGAAHK